MPNVDKPLPFGISIQASATGETFDSSRLEEYLYVPGEDLGSKAEAAARALCTLLVTLRKHGLQLDSESVHLAVNEAVLRLEVSL